MSPALLRAWERRYGLLEPARTSGGLRLYSPADERRVRDMQAGLRRGLSAAEAARAAGSDPGGVRRKTGPCIAPCGSRRALDAMDAESAHACCSTACWRPSRCETVLLPR